jgi:hypothetical protein
MQDAIDQKKAISHSPAISRDTEHIMETEGQVRPTCSIFELEEPCTVQNLR